jgi:hypothetical protein
MENVMKARQLCYFLISCWIFQSASFVATAGAQGLLDQIRGRVEGEIRQALGADRIQPDQPSPPQNRSQSVPWESGNQNNPGGNFRDSGGFLVPSSPPPSSSISPGMTPGRVNPNPQTFPQSGSTPNVSYREVPVRQTSPNGQPIKLKLPDSMSQSVKYQLVLGTRSLDYQMRPGESQTFNETNLWLVRYRSEGSEITYRLRGGKTYEFEVDSQGRISLFEPMPDEFPEPPKR